nr:hypothetical protein [Tanacetum cinerariifolium]
MAFLSFPSSTNKVDTASIQVSAVSTPVSTVSSHDNTANLSDATVYAFLENQPNGSQLVHEDLEQIHEDDLEKIDLKWQLSLLSMRARRYFHQTGKKITINGSDTAGYDKTKVEYFNCHKMGHFARECRSLRNQESMPRDQDNSRKTVNVEDTSSKAMVAIDGAAFDLSYMADDEITTNMALMAFSNSKVSDSDEDEYEEMVLKSKNVQHKPENFAPTTVLTKSGIVPISTARQSSSRAATPVSAVRPINTAASKPLGAPQDALKDQRYFDSGCSRHMTGSISYLIDFKEHDQGYVTFGGGAKGGKITGKGTIRTGKLDFKDVYIFKELQFNLFSVTQCSLY